MIQILKYPLIFSENVQCTITMPEGAKILDVQLQNNIPTIWAIVSEGEMPVNRIFVMLLTGDGLSIGWENHLIYLATLQNKEGFVLHIFEQCAKD